MLYEEDSENEFGYGFGHAEDEDEKSYNGFNEDAADFGEIDSVAFPSIESDTSLEEDDIQSEEATGPDYPAAYPSDDQTEAEQPKEDEEEQGLSTEDLIALYQSDLAQNGTEQATAPTEEEQGLSTEDIIALYQSDQSNKENVLQLENAADVSDEYEDPFSAHERALRNASKLISQGNADVSIEKLADLSIKKEQEYRNENYYKKLLLENEAAAANANSEQEWKDAMTKLVNLRLAQEEDNNIIASGMPSNEIYEFGIDRREKSYTTFDDFVQLKAAYLGNALHATTFFDKQGDNESVNRLRADYLSLFNEESDLTEEGLAVAQGIARLVGASGDETLAEALGSDVESLEKLNAAEDPETAEKIVLSVVNSYRLSNTARQAYEKAQRNVNWENLKELSVDDAVNARAYGIADRRRRSNVAEVATSPLVNDYAGKFDSWIKDYKFTEDASRFWQDFNPFGKSDEELAAKRAKIDRSIIHTLIEGFEYNERGDLLLTPAAQKKLSSFGLADFTGDADANAPMLFTESDSWITPKMRGSILIDAKLVDQTCSEYGVTREDFLKSFKLSMGRRLTTNAEFARGGSLATERIDIDENGNRKRVFGVNLVSDGALLYDEANIKAAEEYIRSRGGSEQDIKAFHDEKNELLNNGMRESEFEEHIKHATGFADWWKKVQSDNKDLSTDEQKDFALTYWGENQGTLDAAWQWSKETGSLVVGGVSSLAGQAIKAVASTPEFLLSMNAQVAQACFDAMGFAAASRAAESVNDFAVRMYDAVDKNNVISSTLNEWGADLSEAGSRFDDEQGKVYGLTKGLAVFGADVLMGGGVGGAVKAGARTAIRQAAAASARGATKLTIPELVGKKLIESSFQKTIKSKGFQSGITKTAKELGLDEAVALENTTRYLASLDLSAVAREYGEYVSRGLSKTAGKDLTSNLTNTFANAAVQDIVFKALPRTAEQLAASKGVVGYFAGKAGADYISGFEEQKTQEAIDFYCTTHGIRREDYEKKVDEATRNDLERKARSRAFVSGYLGAATAMAVSYYCNFKLEEHVSVIGKKLGSGVEKRLASGIGSMPMAATDAAYKRLYGGFGQTVGDMLEALTSKGLTRSASILVASRIMGTTLANTFRAGTSEAVNEIADGLSSYFITTLGQKGFDALDAAEAFSQVLEGGLLGFLGGGVTHNVSYFLPRPKASAESAAKFGGSRNVFLNEQWEKINKAGQAGQDLITRRQASVRNQIKQLESQIRDGVNTEQNRWDVTRLKAVEAELKGLHWTEVTPTGIARLFDGDDTVAQKLLDLQKAARKAGLRYIAMTAQAEAEDRANGLQHWLKQNAGNPITALYEAQWNALNLVQISLQRELGVFNEVPQTLDGIEDALERMQELIQRDAERKDQLVSKEDLTEAEQHELEQINTLQVAAEKYSEYLISKQLILAERQEEENSRITDAETEAEKAAEKESLLGKRIAENNKTIAQIEQQNGDARRRKESIQNEIAALETELEQATDENIRETLAQRISENQGEIAEIDAGLPGAEESLAALVESNNKLYAEHLAASRSTALLNQRASKLASSNYRLLANVENVVNKTSSDLKDAQAAIEQIQYELAMTGRTEEEEAALRSREADAVKKLNEARAAMQDVQNLYLKNADPGLLADMAQVSTRVSKHTEDVDGSMTLATSNPFASGTQASKLYDAIVQEVQKGARKGRGIRINALTERLIKASGLESSSAGLVKDCVVTPTLKAFESAGILAYKGKETFVVDASAVEQPVIPESSAEANAPDFIPAATIVTGNERRVDAWTPVGNSVSAPKTTQAKPSETAGDVRSRIVENLDADAQQPRVSYETIMREALMNRSPRFGDEREGAFNQLFDKVASLLITENGVSAVREKDISDFIEGMEVDAEAKQKLATEYMNEIAYALGLEKQGDVYKVRLTSENEAEFAEAIRKLEKQHGKAFDPLANANTMRAFSQSVDDAREKVSEQMMEEIQALGMATDGSYTSLSDSGFIEAMNKVYGNSESLDVFNRMFEWLNAAGVDGDVLIRPVINAPLAANGIGGWNFQEGQRNGHHQYIIELNVAKEFDAAGAGLFLQTLVHEVGHSFFSEVAFKNEKISSALADVAIEARTQILANQQAILAQFRTQFWMLPPDIRNEALSNLENMLYGVGLRLETTTTTNPDGTPEYSFSFSDQNLRGFSETWQPQEFYTVAISNRMMNWAMKLVGARAEAAEQELRDLISGRQFLGLIMGSYDYGENREEDERMWNDLLALIDQLSDIERGGDPASVAALDVVARSINRGIKESMSQEERAIVEGASGIGENNIGYGYSYKAGIDSSAMFNRAREYARSLKREFNEVSGNDLSPTAFNTMARNAGYDTRTAERNVNVDNVLKENDGVLEASNGTIVDLRGDNPTAMFNIAARQASSTSGIRKESTDFIGEGEGNQSFGWGLYFSTNKGVHSSYTKKFGRKIRAYIRKREVKFDEKTKRLVGDKYKDGEYEYRVTETSGFRAPIKLFPVHTYGASLEDRAAEAGERDMLNTILQAFRMFGKDTIAALSGEAFDYNGKRLTLDELKSELALELREYYSPAEIRLKEVKAALAKGQEELAKRQEAQHELLVAYWKARDEYEESGGSYEPVSVAEEKYERLEEERMRFGEELNRLFEEMARLEEEAMKSYKGGVKRDVLEESLSLIENIPQMTSDIALCFAMNPRLAEKVKENDDPSSPFAVNSFINDHKSGNWSTMMIMPAAQYEVELNADDSNLLLWDSPMPKQSEAVRRLVKDFLEERKTIIEQDEDLLEDLQMIGRDKYFFEELGEEIENSNFKVEDLFAVLSGKQFYKGLLAPFFMFSSQKASEWLLERGIKGIKYLDGGSRYADDPTADNLTYNYVMFSGDDVQITRYNDETSNFEWTDYYDETANFPREGIRPMFNRTSAAPITTSHPVFDNLTGRTAKRQMDPPYRKITIDGEPYSYQTLPAEPVFNLIGSRAKTWGKHFDEGRRPFRSQDGKMKMEINTDTCVWKTEFVGEDGKTYKYESPWQRVPVLGNILSWGNFMPAGETFKISEVLDYPELFEAYPHLKDLRVQRSTFLGANGSYDIDAKLIQFSSTLSLDTARSVLLHELQHAIQEYEGFATGGDQGNTWRFIVDSMTGNIIKTDLPEDLRLSEEEKAQKLLWMQEDWDNSGDWRATIRKNITDTRKRLLFTGRDSGGYIYKRLLGEVEARTVQKRRNYTVEQRKEIPFESDYDVALNEIILSFETRYDWLSYFARTKTEENLYRQHVSNVKQEVRNLLDEGKPKTANIVWKRLIAENEARKQRELFNRNATDVQLVNGVMFNVAGPKSMGFDKNTEGVFEGRDGNLRRELDSSQAKVKDIYVPPSVYTKDYVKTHIEKAIKSSKIKDGLSLLDQYRSKYNLARWIKLQMSGELSYRKYEELATRQEQLNSELSELSSYEDGEKLSPLAKAAMRLANDELAASGYNRNQMLWKNKEVMDSFIHALVSGTTASYKRAITNLFGKFRPSGVFTKKLAEVLDYPALYEAYPQLKDLEVRIGNNKAEDPGDNKAKSGLGKYSTSKNGPFSGWYDSANNYIQLNPLVGGTGTPGPLAAKLTLIHELQHWIQNYEGWPVGDTSALPDDEYWSAPEEVEARTVEMRSIMPENELAELTWLDTYDAEEAFSREAKSGYHSDLYYEAPEQDTGDSQVGFNDKPSAMFNTMARNAGYDTRTVERNVNVDNVLKENDGVLEASNGTIVDLRGDNPTAMFNIAARQASPAHGIRKESTDFIGSGEGAQSYGWGLYFSTNKGVHSHYTNSFKKYVNSLTFPQIEKREVKFDEKGKLLVGDKYKDGEYEIAHLDVKHTGGLGFNIPVRHDLLGSVELLITDDDLLGSLQVFRVLGKDTIAALSGEAVIDHNGKRITLDELRNVLQLELREQKPALDSARARMSEALSAHDRAKLEFSQKFSSSGGDVDETAPLTQAFLEVRRTEEEWISARNDVADIEYRIIALRQDVDTISWITDSNRADIALLFAVNPNLAERVKEGHSHYSVPYLLNDLDEAYNTKKEIPAAQYEVELNADDSNLLLYDSRLSKQGEAVRRFAKTFSEGRKEEKSEGHKEGKVRRFLSKLFSKEKSEDEIDEIAINGEALYDLLVSALGTPKAASEVLLENGIKGIKYLDGLSRFEDANPTYNYVMFSGDDVQVTRYNDETSNFEWTDYYDETANFPREGIRPMFNRVNYQKEGPKIAREIHKEMVDAINATANYKDAYPIDDKMTPERIFKAIFIGDFLNRQGRVSAQIPNHKIYQATIANGFNKKRFTTTDVTDSFVFALVSALSDAKSQGRRVPEEMLDMFNSLKDRDDLDNFKALIKTFITHPLIEATGSDAGAAMLGGFSRLIGLNAGLEIRGIDTMEKTVPGVFMHLNEHMVNMRKLLGRRNRNDFSTTLVQRQKEAGVFSRDFHLLSMKVIPSRIRKMLGLNWRNVESDEQVAAELKKLVRRQELRVDLGVSTIHTFNDRFDKFLEAAKTEKERKERAVLVGDALGSNRALYDKKEFDAIDREYNADIRRVESEFEIATQNTNDSYKPIFSNLENTRQKTREKYNADIKRRKQNGASEEEVKKIEEERDRALQEIDDKTALARASLNEEIMRANENRTLQKQAAALEASSKKDSVRNSIAGEIRVTQKKARQRLEYMSASGDAKATEMLQAIDEARKQIDQDMDLRMKNDREFAEAARGSEGIYLPRLYLASLKGLDESKKRFEAIKNSSEGDALFDLRRRVENRVAENVAIKNTEGFYKDWSDRLSEAAALTSYMDELERSDETEAQEIKKSLEALVARTKPFMQESFTVAKLLTKDKDGINYYKTFAPLIAYGKDKFTVTGDTFDETWAKSFVYRLITQQTLTLSEVELTEAIRKQEASKASLPKYSDTISTAVSNTLHKIVNSKKTKDIKEHKKEAASNLKSRGSIQLLRKLGLNGIMDTFTDDYRRKHDGEYPTQAEIVKEVAEEIISLSADGERQNPTGNELIDNWVAQSYSIADSYALMPSTEELLLELDGTNKQTLDELRHDTVIDSFIAKLEDYAMSRGYVDGIDRKELHDKIVHDVREANKDYLWNYVESLFFKADSTDLNTRHDLPQEYMQMLGAQLLDNAESIKDTVHSGVTAGLRESTGIDFYKRFVDIASKLQDQGFAFTSKPTEEQAAAFGHEVSDYVDIGDIEKSWIPKGVKPITSSLYVLKTVVEDARRVYDAFQNNTDSDSTVIAAEKSQIFSKGLRKIISTVNAMPLISGFTPTIRNFMGMIPMVVVPTGVNKARIASSAYTAARTCALFLDSLTTKSRRAEFFARLDTYKEMGVVETNALYTIRHSDWSTLEEIAVRTKGNVYQSAMEAIGKAQLFMGKFYSLPDSLGKIISYEANFADLCDFKAFKPEYDAAVERANADGVTENMIVSNHALLKKYMKAETFDTINSTAIERMTFEQPSSATTPDWIHSRIPIYKDDPGFVKGWKYALNTFTQINGPFMMFHYNMLRSVIKNFQFGLNDLQQGLRNGDLFGQAWSGVNRICSGAALLVHPFTEVMVPGNIAQTIFTQVILAIMNAEIDDDEHKWKSVDVDNSALVIDMIDAKLLADYWDTQDGIVICRENEEGTHQFTVAMTDFVNPYSSYTSTARHIVNAYKTGDWKALQKATRSLLGPLCDHHLFLQRILEADKYVDRRDIALPKGYGRPDIKTSFLGVIGGLAFDDPKIFLDEDARLSQEAAKLASFVGFLSPDIVRRSARVLSSYGKGDDAQMAATLGIAGFGSIYPQDSVKTLSSRLIKNNNDYREAYFWLERKEKNGTLSEQGKKVIEDGRALRDKNERLIIQAARTLGVEQDLRRSIKKSSRWVKRTGLSKDDLRRLRQL